MRYGTGAAQTINEWYAEFWATQIANRGPIFTILGGILLILVFVAEIVMWIVDTVVEVVKRIVRLFRYTDDDDARSVIESSTPEELRALPDADVVALIDDMLVGSTGDKDEEAICTLLSAIEDCDRLRRILRSVGLARLGRNVDGAQEGKLAAVLRTPCEISIYFSDDEAREAVRDIVESGLGATSDYELVSILDALLYNEAGEKDEEAILDLLEAVQRASPEGCDRIDRLVAAVGGRSRLDGKVDGDEQRRLDELCA